MNRLQFLRRITMATGALMIPKEAIAWTQQPEVFAAVEEEVLLPGVGGQMFKIYLERGIFVANDIIQVMSSRREYYLREREGKLIGEDIFDPTAPPIEIEWIDKPTEEARKICSAIGES